MSHTIIRPLQDPRPDFFLGVALIFIFVGEMSGNALSSFTLPSTSYWNAAIIFIFVSGYSAGLTYGRAQQRQGALVATLKICQRTWHTYVTYIVVFAIFAGEVSGSAILSRDLSYMDDMGLSDFLVTPHIAIVKVLLLNFQPHPLAILPLYLVLLAFFPLFLQLMSRNRLLALCPAIVIYVGSQPWLSSGNSSGLVWHYNPLAWQLPFIIGATCGYQALGGWALLTQRWVTIAAAGFVILCAATDLSWLGHQFYEPLPALFYDESRPLVDDADLGPLRILNFLALAIVVARALPRASNIVRATWLYPVVLCGRHASQLLCVGILLGVLSRVIVRELHGGIAFQLAMCAFGIAAMTATALLLQWYANAGYATSPRLLTRTSAPDTAGPTNDSLTTEPDLPKAA